MSMYSVFSDDDSKKMEDDLKCVYGFLGELEKKYNKALDSKKKQDILKETIKKYDDLNKKWKGKPKKTNLLNVILSGILYAVIAFLGYAILFGFLLAFITMLIFGEDGLDYVVIIASIITAVYLSYIKYTSANDDYVFYTTTNITNLNDELQQLLVINNEFNMLYIWILNKLPRFVSTHYLSFHGGGSSDRDWFSSNWCTNNQSTTLGKFLLEYYEDYRFNINAWFLAIQNSKQTYAINRAAADRHEQQMQEAYRMRDIAEKELKYQQEQSAYASKQLEVEKENLEAHQQCLEIEREKLYHLRKIRDEIENS